MTSGAAIPDADNPAGADPEGYRAALEAIKAIHAAGGTLLSKAETVEFILTPIYLGPPVRLKPKGVGRGPQSRDTQYDRAYERRKGIYHDLVRNPASAGKGGQATRAKAVKMRDLITWFAAGMSVRVPKSKRVSKIIADCNGRSQYPSRSTVQRVLLEIDKRA